MKHVNCISIVILRGNLFHLFVTSIYIRPVAHIGHIAYAETQSMNIDGSTDLRHLA